MNVAWQYHCGVLEFVNSSSLLVDSHRKRIPRDRGRGLAANQRGHDTVHEILGSKGEKEGKYWKDICVVGRDWGPRLLRRHYVSLPSLEITYIRY